MANSLIDDMFSENSQFNGNTGGKKGKNGKKIILVFIVLLIIVAIIAAMFMIKKMGNKGIVTGKEGFIKYLSQGDFLVNNNNDVLEEVFEKLKNNSSEINSDVTISTNMSNIEELANYKAEINTKYDSDNSRGLIDINLDYLDNDIFNMQTLITGKSFALKSDEIVTRYVGYKYDNLLNGFSTTSDETEEMSLDIEGNVLLSGLESFDYQVLLDGITPEFVKSEINKYVQVLNNIDESKFSQKEVTLKRENGNINATAYVLTLNEDELIKFSTKLLEELMNDTELISMLVSAFEPTGIGIDENVIKTFIDQIINETYEVEGNSEEIYTFTIYVADSKIVKMTIENSKMSFDVDCITDDNNNSNIITILEKETNSGIKLDFNRVSNDVSEEIGIEVSVIDSNEVISKVSVELLLKGITSQTSMTIDVNVSHTDTTNEFDLNISTDVEFRDVEVEDLTIDNCLFLDELNPEERTIVMDSIKVRTSEVLADKQNQINLINSNTGSSIIEGQPDVQDDDTQRKEDAKERLINAVANEMYVAQQNEQEYTVNDIADLQIEGTDVEVVVENDIATVVIDGYTFSINAGFELTETE